LINEEAMIATRKENNIEALPVRTDSTASQTSTIRKIFTMRRVGQSERDRQWRGDGSRLL
jgi:hypothetical protein